MLSINTLNGLKKCKGKEADLMAMSAEDDEEGRKRYIIQI